MPLSTNTGGSLVPQAPTLKGVKVKERPGKEEIHEQFGSPKKRLPADKAKLNLDHMDSRTSFGDIVDTLSSIFSKIDTAFTQSKMGVGAYLDGVGIGINTVGVGIGIIL